MQEVARPILKDLSQSIVRKRSGKKQPGNQGGPPPTPAKKKRKEKKPFGHSEKGKRMAYYNTAALER